MKCLICKRDMRPYGVPKVDAPDTVSYHGRGLCTKDYREQEKHGFPGYPELGRGNMPTGPGVTYTPAPADATHVADLQAFFNRRRTRTRPTTRVDHDPDTGLWAIIRNNTTIGHTLTLDAGWAHLDFITPNRSKAA